MVLACVDALDAPGSTGFSAEGTKLEVETLGASLSTDFDHLCIVLMHTDHCPDQDRSILFAPSLCWGPCVSSANPFLSDATLRDNYNLARIKFTLPTIKIHFCIVTNKQLASDAILRFFFSSELLAASLPYDKFEEDLFANY